MHKCMNAFKFFFVVAIVFVHSLASAQAIYYSDTVWVESRRLGYSFLSDYPTVSVIEGERLNSEHMRDIIELVSRDGHILLGRYSYMGGVGLFNVRGRNGAVLLDGFSIDMPQLGGLDLGWVPVLGVGLFELVRGSGSIFYGSDALGGALNMIPPRLDNDSISSIIYLERGNLSYKRTSAGLSSRLSSIFNYRIDISELGSSGVRDGENFSSRDFSSNFMWKIGGLNFGLWVLRHNGASSISQPSASEPPPVSNDNMDMSIAELRSSAFLTSTKWLSLKFLYSNMNEEFSSPYAISSHKNRSFSSRLEFLLDSTAFGSFSLSGEGQVANVKSSDVGEHKLSRFAFVFANRARLASSLFAGAGVRLEQPFKGAFKALPLLACKWEPSSLFVFADFRMGFRSPTLNDLYWRYSAIDFDGDTLFDFISTGDSSLVPEINWTGEIGCGVRGYGSLNLFFSRAKDLIEWRNVDTSLSGGYWKPTNVKSWSDFLGLEIMAHFRAKSLEITPGATFLDARDYSGERLPYRPRILLDIDISSSQKFLHGDLEIKAGISGRYWDGLLDDTQKKLNCPGLLDARAEIRYLTFSLFITGENLLGKSYELRRGYPLPGRSFRGGFSVRFKE